MEKKMETTIVYWGYIGFVGLYWVCWGIWGFPKIRGTYKMENQMQKKMENDMETGII